MLSSAAVAVNPKFLNASAAVVASVPPFAIAIVVPFQVPVPIVPTSVIVSSPV